MSVQEVARKLVDLCRQGRNMDAIRELYADDIVAVEAAEGGGMPREMRGKQAIKALDPLWRLRG